MKRLSYPFIASPHHKSMTAKPTGIVLHSTGAETASSSITWFKNPESEVSAHFVVDTDGSVVQMVELDQQAYHAGKSAYKGRAYCNQFMIGIEQVHVDQHDTWPIKQVKATAEICAKLMTTFGIAEADIVSHAAVATPKGRKIDPYAYPWQVFYEYLHLTLHPIEVPSPPVETPTVQIGEHAITGRLDNGRIYVPIRDVLQALGHAFVYEPDTKRLIVQLEQKGA